MGKRYKKVGKRYKMCPRIPRAFGSLERGRIGKIKLIIN